MASSLANISPSGNYVPPNITAKTRNRVNIATAELPTGSRCLIENSDPESNAVDYAHCLPRNCGSDPSSLMSHLEFVWNLQRQELYIDTRFNIMILGAKFHYLFDANLWLLLPEESILRKYHAASNTQLTAIEVRNACPVIKNPSYKYTLIPHPSMKQVPIHRKMSNDNDEPAARTDFTFYSFPYSDFPTIESHVHPKFVICNAGQKLSKHLSGEEALFWKEDDFGRNYESLRMIQEIWSVWKGKFKGSDSYKAFKRSPCAPKFATGTSTTTIAIDSGDSE